MRWRPVTSSEQRTTSARSSGATSAKCWRSCRSPQTEVVIESVAHGGSGYNVVIRMVGEVDEILLRRAGRSATASRGWSRRATSASTPLAPADEEIRGVGRRPKRRRTRRRRLTPRARLSEFPWPPSTGPAGDRGVARRHRRGPGSRRGRGREGGHSSKRSTVAVRGVWLRRPSSPKTLSGPSWRRTTGSPPEGPAWVTVKEPDSMM